MINRNKLGYEIYKIVASNDYGFTISMFNEDGESSITPINANWMYLKPENIMIKIPGSDEAVRDEISFWKSSDLDDPKIKDIARRLKDTCHLFGAGFTIKDFASNNQPRDFHKLIKREQEEIELHQMDESIMLEGLCGSSTRSTLTLESAKLVITHSKRISEEVHGSRSRHIKDIFIECNGEKIRYPVKHLPSARVMVQHYNCGGSITDKMGKYIVENARDLMEMRKFLRENNSSKFSGKVAMFVESIKKEFTRLQRPSGYKLAKVGVKHRDIVGKSLIGSRAVRYQAIDGLLESPESKKIMEVIAKHDIRESLTFQPTFRRVMENCGLGLNSKMIRNASKRIARGEINATHPIIYIKSMPVRTKIQNYARQMAKTLNHIEIANVMKHISTSKIDSDIVEFVKGVMKSISLNDCVQPEMEEAVMFESWINEATVITESFDDPFDETEEDWDEMEDDDEYSPTYQQDIPSNIMKTRFKSDDGVQYMWYAKRNQYDDTTFEIVFGVEKDGSVDISGKSEIDINKTGSGNQMRVFATVLGLTNRFVETYDDSVMRLTFTADTTEGPSRAKLYKRLVDKHIEGFEVTTVDAREDEVYFELTRN